MDQPEELVGALRLARFTITEHELHARIQATIDYSIVKEAEQSSRAFAPSR
jgi:hypothetical protein